ncbi:MAG: PEGA domain-containing protein [Polyangia bacterium]
MSRVLSVFLLLAVACPTARADHKTRVAVLEYRAGSRGAAGIGARIAAALAHSSAYDVMDPADAKRRIGAALDADVARCAGEAKCIASLGQRLGVDEALLVGVSELGDIVLALQRVDTRRGVAVSRLAESIPAGSEPKDEELTDWLHQLFPADAFLRYGELRVISDVRDANVLVNGNKMGETPLPDPLHLAAPGNYRLRVEKPGFVSFQARIDVPPDSTIEVRATLSRGIAETPWYKRAYVWGPIGGVLAAAGLGVAIYYGTRVDQTPHGFVVVPVTK